MNTQKRKKRTTKVYAIEMNDGVEYGDYYGPIKLFMCREDAEKYLDRRKRAEYMDSWYEYTIREYELISCTGPENATKN